MVIQLSEYELDNSKEDAFVFPCDIQGGYIGKCHVYFLFMDWKTKAAFWAYFNLNVSLGRGATMEYGFKQIA